MYVLSKNKKKIKLFLLKIFNFYNLKKICILHGRVFVMIKGHKENMSVQYMVDGKKSQKKVTEKKSQKKVTEKSHGKSHRK